MLFNPKIQNSFYNLVDKTSNFKAKMKILPVDFHQAWWHILWSQQKFLVFFVFFTQFISSVFDSLYLLILGKSIEQLNYTLMFGLFGLQFCLILLYNLMSNYNIILQIQTMGSVEYAANKFFLTTDPINHATKSSGQIVAKVGRGSSAYEDVLDVLTFDMLDILTSILTVTISLFAFGWQLGAATLIFILVIAGFNIWGQILRTQTFEPKVIKTDDKLKAISVETLQQTPFIRSIFATPEQDQKMRFSITETMVAGGNSWRSGDYINIITRILYVLSVLVLAFLIMQSIQKNELSSIIGVSLILTYTNSASRVLHIGGRVKKLTKSLNNIQDLYTFIRNFGQSSYPVLKQ